MDILWKDEEEEEEKEKRGVIGRFVARRGESISSTNRNQTQLKWSSSREDQSQTLGNLSFNFRVRANSTLLAVNNDDGDDDDNNDDNYYYFIIIVKLTVYYAQYH